MKVIEAQRVGVCVDVQNMYYAARNIFNGRLNFQMLLDTIVKGRQLVRAIAYVIEDGVRDQSSFFTVLGSCGFDVKSKPLRVRADGTSKGDWDMGIALDALALSEKVDVIALVTGDGDFTDLVYFLRSRGVRVEVYSFPRCTAESLVKATDEFTPLDEELVIPMNKNRRDQAKSGPAGQRGQKDSPPSPQPARKQDEFSSGIFDD